jgi:hypothetical protein
MPETLIKAWSGVAPFISFSGALILSAATIVLMYFASRYVARTFRTLCVLT